MQHLHALYSGTNVISIVRTRHRPLWWALTCVLTFMLAGQAQADILATSGAMVEVAPPPSLLSGVFESSTEIRIIDEGSKFLVVPLFVDGFGPGPQLPAGPLDTLPPGLLVHTYIVHFDPDGGVVSLSGDVTFDPGEIIVGLAMHPPYLGASDGFPVGDPFIAYPTGSTTRGFETLPGTDSATIAGDLNSVTFDLHADLGVDQARIFTVPEPSTIVLLVVVATLSGRRRC
jgi:hypothetical protein